MTRLGKLKISAMAGFAVGMIGTASFADQVFADDVIVQGSLCAGLDCVNGESFGFDTIRMKENNLRLNATDTSTSASFPSTDWTLTFNESSNGGANKFSVDDITAGRTPFTIEGGSQNHTLYVDSNNRIGIGTSAPVTTLHASDGNTPTLRLEQDGSDGFTAQTWDLAGNEANFFVRDATNGSTLPLRIFPSAPTDSLAIRGTTGHVGLGTNNPDSNLHVFTSAPAEEVLLHIENSGAGASSIMQFENGQANWQFKNNGTTGRLTIGAVGENVPFKLAPDADENLLKVGTTATNQVDITGNLVITGSCTSGCDRVFDETYPLPSIQDHAKAMFEKKHLPNVGPTNDDAPVFNIAEKIGGMLNELEHAHIYISQMHESMQLQNETIAALEARLKLLEK